MWRTPIVAATVVLAACRAPEPPRPVPMFIDGSSGRLYVEDGGAGLQLPVVLIHSLAGNSAQWTPQLVHLRRARRAVALDLRGHGRSEAPRDGRYALADFATDVQRVMDALGIRRAVVVGHSLGGGVAVALAGLIPDRIAGVFLADPIDDPSKRPADENADAFLRRLDSPEYSSAIEAYWEEILKGASDSVRRQVLADLRSTPPGSVLGPMRAMAGFDAEAALAGYSGPIVALTTPLNEFPSSLHRVVRRIRQERMTGVSHWLHLDRPAEFNASLDAFLAAISE